MSIADFNPNYMNESLNPPLKNTGGRPTLYSEELAKRICTLLAEGKSLRTICLADDMPDKSTVFDWLRKYPGFADHYAHAKEASADALMEEIVDIADSAEEAIVGDDKSDGARVQAIKLRVDARKWAASKLKPKKYGDKMDVTSDHKALQSNTIIVKDFSK